MIRARPMRYAGVILVWAGIGLAGCGTDTLERASMASAAQKNTTRGGASGCPASGDAGFTLRVVYNVINSYERDALKNAGAPTQARGITQSELIIRDQATLVRRTGKTYIKDPQKYLDWMDAEEEIHASVSNEQFLSRAAAWKVQGKNIPMKTVPIEWVDMRAPPGGYSYRYGLDPMVPLYGEKWREDDRGWDVDDINEALFDQAFSALDPAIIDGVEVSESTFAGIKCEMLRRRVGRRVHETCYANIDGHMIVLHGMDKTPEGLFSQTATSVETGLCVPDQMLAAPGRVDFEDVS